MKLLALLVTIATMTACNIVVQQKADGGPGDDSGAVEDSGTPTPSTTECPDVPFEGKCLDAQTVAYCEAPTGNGEPAVHEKKCGAFEECAIVGGAARCQQKVGTCTPKATECTTDKTALRVCNDKGEWTTQPCPTQCETNPLESYCRETDSAGSVVPTGTFSGTVSYEYRTTNSTTAPTGWSSTVQVATVPRVLVISYRGDSTIAATEADDEGRFTIKVPTPLQAGDQLVVWALRTKPGGLDAGMAFGLAAPKVPDGTWNVGDDIPGASSGFWGWKYDLTKLAPGADLKITEAQGSGAMRVFDYLRYAYDSTYFLMKKPGKSLVIWLRYNTSWSCGACMSDWPARVGDFKMDSQIFIPAVDQDRSYWSEAVTAHELGHWTMASFSRSPNEGGRHCVGVPTYPGQAWSEGWATLFSSLVREDTIYADKQGGGFFWFDIGKRRYTSKTWQRPAASRGLHQLIDENEVAAMGWALANHPTTAGTTLAQNVHLLKALNSPRMMASPWAREYTRHSWKVAPGSCEKTGEKDVGASAPMFADYLDAVMCSAAVSKPAIDAVTNPSANYPYPSDSPICK